MSSHHDCDQTALPTLQELRRKTALTSRQIAEAAQVPLRTEYLMEIGGRVEPQDAERVLEAFSQLTGETYSLNTVRVSLAHHTSPLPNKRPGAGNKVVAPTIRKVKLFS